MSNLTSVSQRRLKQKAEAAEAAQKHINDADKTIGTRGKRLSVEIPESLHKHLKRVAIERDTSVRELVVLALQDAYKGGD